MAVLTINDLTKVYSKSKKNKGGAVTALDHISFSLDKGEIVGLIGPNGAGKSTIIKCITGLARPTSGEVRINGYDAIKEHAKAVAKVGAIIESPDMYKDWSGLENLTYLASISLTGEDKLDRSGIKERAESLLRLVGLYDRRDDKVRKYSLGMKQRLGIAQALLCRPDMLILDEPTNGLDPEGTKEIRDIIIHLAHDLGIAVLVSSHNLSELQLTCDRFVIIKKGKIIAAIKADELTKDSSHVIITVDDTVAAIDVLKKELGIEACHAGDGKLEAETDVSAGDIAKTLVLNGLTVSGISAKQRSLEELFLSATEEKKESKKEEEHPDDKNKEGEGKTNFAEEHDKEEE